MCYSQLVVSSEKAKNIFRSADCAVGLFLLADLVWKNLLGQSSIDGLERELEPDAFPNTINKAFVLSTLSMFCH
jgi:hypothetical protein